MGDGEQVFGIKRVGEQNLTDDDERCLIGQHDITTNYQNEWIGKTFF